MARQMQCHPDRLVVTEVKVIHLGGQAAVVVPVAESRYNRLGCDRCGGDQLWSRFRWTAGDMFITPSWAAVDHEAADDADLFLFSDQPTLDALGLARTEKAPQQNVLVDDAG